MQIIQSGQKYLIFASATNIGVNCAFFIYEANSFRLYTSTIFSTSTIIMITVCLGVIAFYQSSLFKLLDFGLKRIEMRIENPQLRVLYEENNETTEKWCKFTYILLFKFTPIFFVMPKAIFIYLAYFTTDSDSRSDVFDLPFPMWFPFNWRNPFGYLAAIVVQYILTVYFFLLAASAISLGLSAYLLANTIADDAKASLNAFNKNVKIPKKRLPLPAAKQIFDFIDMHSFLLQLIGQFFKLIQMLCAVFITWCSIVICASLLLFQVEISKPEIDSIALLITIGDVVDVGITCEVGQRTSDIFSVINDKINDIDWYLYPIEIQHILSLIMIVTQKPILVEFFGSITASRETFRKVMKRGFSCFTVFREFTK